MLITALIYFSLIVTTLGAIPYIVDVVKKKTKPRIVSWAVWSVLTAIAGIASFVDGQIPAALLMVVVTLESLAIVALGYKNGDRRLEKLDIICLIGAAAGLILWWFSGSPDVAVIVTIIIDLVGAIPTLVHSWKKPHEETWLSFLLIGIGSFATILAAESWKITAVAYALYIVLMNGFFVVVILTRRKYAVAGVPKDLRRL
jgi:hypothetical protein